MATSPHPVLDASTVRSRFKQEQEEEEEEEQKEEEKEGEVVSKVK